MRNALVFVGIGALVLAGGWWIAVKNTETAVNPHRDAPKSTVSTKEESPPEPTTSHQGASIGEENAVEFTCAGGKSMTAVFTRDIIGITLSDGRQLTLRQAESGSGIRYLNNTQTIEFRGKGDEAYLEENGAMTYRDCTAAQ